MLAAAIDRALAKQAADRFASAEDMAEAMAPSRAVTGELPVPVLCRVWVERGRELKGDVRHLVLLLLRHWHHGVRRRDRQQPVGLPWHSCSCSSAQAPRALPWIGHGLWRINQTRRAFEAGITFDDLRHGLDVAVARREEELRYERSRPVHWLPRLVRIGTYAALAVALGALIGGSAMGEPRRGVVEDAFFQLFGESFTMVTIGGALFGLVFPGRRLGARDSAIRLRRWLWDSPLGRGMARVAAIGLLAARSSWSTWRPTETALGSVTETLFAALPDSERAAIADLPDVVARLEREAVFLAREHLDHGDGGAWGDRLEQAVAAIETLRVGLLRLAAGHTAASSLTADLDAARELSARIDYLVAGAAEVSELLDGGTGSRQSSTQAAPRSAPATTSLG